MPGHLFDITSAVFLDSLYILKGVGIDHRKAGDWLIQIANSQSALGYIIPHFGSNSSFGAMKCILRAIDTILGVDHHSQGSLRDFMVFLLLCEIFQVTLRYFTLIIMAVKSDLAITNFSLL